jgi:hypothetical protein
VKRQVTYLSYSPLRFGVDSEDTLLCADPFLFCFDLHACCLYNFELVAI